MIKKVICQPFLDANNQKLLKFLKKKGVNNIKWYINNKLRGNAWGNLDKENNLEIVFKNEDFINQYGISHELLHAVLFVKGYPQIICRPEHLERYETAITVLDNIFDHIGMIPYFRNGVIQKDECIVIEKNIDEMDEFIDKNQGVLDKRMLLNIFYVRAKTMKVGDNKLQQLKDCLVRNNLYDEKIVKAILKHLPEKESHIGLKLKCVKELGVNDLVEFKYFYRRGNASEL